MSTEKKSSDNNIDALKESIKDLKAMQSKVGYSYNQKNEKKISSISEFGKLILEGGKLKKIKFHEKGFTYKSLTKNRSHMYDEIKKINYYFESFTALMNQNTLKLEFIFKDPQHDNFKARFRIYNIILPIISRKKNSQIMGIIQEICKIYIIELCEKYMAF